MARKYTERRLAAILAADVVGYSRLVSADEDGTLDAFRRHLKEFIEPLIAEHRGRLFKTMGDGLLVEFASVVEAVECAVALQNGMPARNNDVPPDRRLEFRIGINLGDVVAEADDVFGDGVNVAARLEGLAEPGGIVISRAARDQIRDKLGYGLEDLGEVEVKNIPRPVRVFQLLLDRSADERAAPQVPEKRKMGGPLIVFVAAVLLAGGIVAGWWLYRGDPPVDAPSHRLADKKENLRPVVAVLPFDNLSRDPEQDYFSDGITDDLINDLSRISGLFVIARNTMVAYKGRAIKVQKLAEEVGASYVLEGSVRKAGSRVRINTQLVDASTGHQMWADRYDRELKDVFALQDEVVQKIVSALSIQLRPAEKAELDRAKEAHPEAYDMLLRGLEFYRRFTHETIIESQGYFRQAIALDPNYARAHADLALSQVMLTELGFSVDPGSAVQSALETAKTALALDEDSREVHFALAIINRALRRHNEALTSALRAIEIDPNYADGYAVLALTHNYSGNPDKGLEAITYAAKLNPRRPFFYRWILGQSHYLLGNYEDALELFEGAKTSNPGFTPAHKMLAATYVALGQIEDAEWAAVEMETLIPNYTVATEPASSPYKDEKVLKLLLGWLRSAGLGG